MAYSPGNGTVIQAEISAVFTTITQCTMTGIPGMERTPIETTDLDDTWSNFIVGLPRSKELEFELNYDPAAATHAYLDTIFRSGASNNFKVILADAGAAVFAFGGYVVDFSPGEATVDGLVKFKGKIRISGAITLTP